MEEHLRHAQEKKKTRVFPGGIPSAANAKIDHRLPNSSNSPVPLTIIDYSFTVIRRPPWLRYRTLRSLMKISFTTCAVKTSGIIDATGSTSSKTGLLLSTSSHLFRKLTLNTFRIVAINLRPFTPSPHIWNLILEPTFNFLQIALT